MTDIEKIQDQHTAGAQAIAFDYQFYYFMCLALDLRHGDKVGFEIKDDVHIDQSDGTTILFQAKHTILNKADGTPENLTTLDVDLWKTLSNWVHMIKVDDSLLKNYHFCLVTNKEDGNNEFIDSHAFFKKHNNVDEIFGLLKELQNRTKNKEVKSYIKNVLSLRKKKLELFLLKLSFETCIDDIISKVKAKILESCRQENFVDAIFESLSSNMNAAKYLDIKDRKRFEITFDDFNKRFGKCFQIAFEKKPLPRRDYPISLPDKLEEQIFVKQLIDIGEITSKSPLITEYTRQMLQVINLLTDWIENNFVLPTEMEDFKKEAVAKWRNEFRAKYRSIERQIDSGTSIENLETEIQTLGLQMIDFLRRENLAIANDTLGIELSNGHYYALSNTPEIGWHYNWEKRYKPT